MYLNKVADVLLKDLPEVRKKLRFYTVRSSSVNAFTSEDGIILVNMGLMAHVKDEAQLAFILCHEISHYVHNHPLEIFLNNKEEFTAPAAAELQQRAYEKALVETNKYSKEKEEEADQLGLELFLNSPYSLGAAVEVFDVLKKADDLFEDFEFSPEVFQTENLKLDQYNFFKNEEELSNGVKEAPNYSTTHPSTKRRQTLIRRKVRKMDNSKRSKFIVSEKSFYNIQKKYQFGLVNQYLLEKKYERAIYVALVLENKFGYHSALKRQIGYALYALAKYANAGQFWDVHVDYEEKNQPENRLNFFMSRLVDEELNLLAILFNWEVLKTEPNPRSVRLLNDIIFEFNKDFFKPPYFQNNQSDTSSLGLFKRALKFSLEDGLFKQIFEQAQVSIPFLPIESLNPSIPGDINSIKKKKVQGHKFGIESAVIVDPFFLHYDDRKETALQYSSSKIFQQQLLSFFHQYGERKGSNYTIISPSNFQSHDTDRFNQMASLKLWIFEKENHGKLQLISLFHNEILQLVEEFGTPYIISTGGISVSENRKSKNLTLGAGFIFPPVLPYSLYYVLTPKQGFLFYNMIYNLEQDSKSSILSKRIRMKASESVMKAAVYDFYLQLYSKPND
ncbi:MAG: M48 family metallopeptidase [Bacteroidota bacterium]